MQGFRKRSICSRLYSRPVRLSDRFELPRQTWLYLVKPGLPALNLRANVSRQVTLGLGERTLDRLLVGERPIGVQQSGQRMLEPPSRCPVQLENLETCPSTRQLGHLLQYCRCKEPGQKTEQRTVAFALSACIMSPVLSL
jgi:hypothetical protein